MCSMLNPPAVVGWAESKLPAQEKIPVSRHELWQRSGHYHCPTWYHQSQLVWTMALTLQPHWRTHIPSTNNASDFVQSGAWHRNPILRVRFVQTDGFYGTSDCVLSDVWSCVAVWGKVRLAENHGQYAVVRALTLLILEYRIAGFTIRNDNGSQFIAKMVREFLIEKGVIQEFTHVATPEENSYIEALQSIVQREVVDRFEFESFHHSKMVFYRYYEWNNNERKHGSLGRISPEEFVKTRA